MQQEMEEEPLYRHEFSNEELGMMLFEPDENVYPVHEYHYMKKEWQTVDAFVEDPNRLEEKLMEAEQELQEGATDDTIRAVTDLSNSVPEGEELVYLDLETEETAQVVLFYAPWCPHCQHFKYEYVDIAREVTRRSIGTPVQFHAVSCAVYHPLCRAYDINGFPIVYGWQLGSSVWEAGIELNPENEGGTMTAENVAELLALPLAHEMRDEEVGDFFDSEDNSQREKALENLEVRAAGLKTEWHEYPSTLNDRFHNAAASLAFALKNGVYTGEIDELTASQKMTLQNFFDLVFWTTPEAWHARALVKELRDKIEVIATGRSELIEIVDRHLSTEIEIGLWGDLELPREQFSDTKEGSNNNDDEYSVWRRNSQWTEACTHGKQGMGFTCGLWDLFHIITLGASLSYDQLSEFHSGYMTSPRDVAEIIEQFIVGFFPCDVCRFNFKDMYASCAYDHCSRLAKVIPALVSNSSAAFDQAKKELVMWLWEVHNGVNIRIMKESATRENRVVSDTEKAAAVFPTKEMCPTCWLDDSMEKWNQGDVFDFLMCWYWPSVKSFRKRCERHISKKERPWHSKKNIPIPSLVLPTRVSFAAVLLPFQKSVSGGLFFSIPLFVSLALFVFFSKRIILMRKQPSRQKLL